MEPPSGHVVVGLEHAQGRVDDELAPAPAGGQEAELATSLTDERAPLGRSPTSGGPPGAASCRSVEAPRSAGEATSKKPEKHSPPPPPPQQQQQIGKRDTKKETSDQSGSIQLELEHIKMHEQLLMSGQQKLISQLKANKPAAGELMSCAIPMGGAQRAAIECRNLSYGTGLGAFQKTILQGLTLTVPEGSIYGLLGPSGCGKTTLLRCISGRLKPGAGSHIRVLGFRPNARGSQIPGPAIGYMPQELSLYEEFSLDEMLTYFGRINRMRPDLLAARIDFLLKFLGLPSKLRHIKSLSGGQKRRVSLAVALVHAPPLLILDEPTVGVDPLLRQTIWNYLVTLATVDRITILITTHYVEEARQANTVGLMREGRLLAEDNPQTLMRVARMSSLEAVFLKLCVDSLVHQPATGQGEKEAEEEAEEEAASMGAGKGRATSPAGSLTDSTGSDPVCSSSLREPEAEPRAGPRELAGNSNSNGNGNGNGNDSGNDSGNDNREAPREAREFIGCGGKRLRGWPDWLAILLTVTWKNYLGLRRNPAVFLFQLFLPALQMVLFCICIGGAPFDIPLAVANEERSPLASEMFLGSLSRVTFRQVPYGSLDAAIESVRAGDAWAALHIPPNFTRSLNERLLRPAQASRETIANGTISIYPDLTNLHLALAIESALMEAFVKFSRSSLKLLGYEPQLADLPVRLAEPVYGQSMVQALDTSPKSGYLEFMAPGVVISVTYAMATGLTALVFILEKRDGLLERSQVSGVTTSQILLAHALLQLFVMALQVALMLSVTFYAFAIPSRGPLVWAAALVLLQGCSGMAFGLLISALCRGENEAIMMLVGTFYINLILAGIMWPLEAMPRWLRPISYLQPQTLPVVGLRNILSRGWSVDEPSVQLAFLVTAAWLVVFLLSAGLCMRYIK